MSNFHFLTFSLLFNIIFVLSEPLPQERHNRPLDIVFKKYNSSRGLPKFTTTTEEIIVEPTTTSKSVTVDSDITEALGNVLSTTEKTIDTSATPENIETTTAKKGARDCLKGQSSFSKEDLVVMIDHIAEKELNIIVSINESYHDIAVSARDKFAQEFNDFQSKIIEHPEHLDHIIKKIDRLRQTKLVPLAHVAISSIKELPEVENDFNRLLNKAKNMLQKFEKIENLCNWNCNPQYRSSLYLQGRRQEPFLSMRQDVVLKPTRNNDEDLCSTLDYVYNTVREQLTKFKQEEIAKLKQEITVNGEFLNKSIQNLKKSLKEAAVNQFGMTMYDLLSLYDDHYHLIIDLEDFNKQSLIVEIKKNNMNVELILLDLDVQMQKYKAECIGCNSVQHQRAGESDKGPIENEDETKPIEAVSNKNDSNILNELISKKIQEITATVQANLQNIFKDFNETVNDTELVEKTGASLKPIQDKVNVLIQQRKQALQALTNGISMESIEKVYKLYQDSSKLAADINTVMIVFDERL